MPAGPKRKIQRDKLPEYAIKIAALRGSEKQGEFARRLGISPMGVSHWETGSNEPGPKMYLELARMAQGEQREFFLLQAKAKSGLTFDAIEVIHGMGAAVKRARAAKKRAEGFVEIPLIDATAGAGPGNLDGAEGVLGMLTFPRDLIPNPSETRCLRVQGESMAPTIANHALAAVDRSQTRVENLLGKVVVVRHDVEGLRVKRLVQVGSSYLLASDNPGHETLAFDRGWQIVGKVVWWVKSE